MLIEKRQEIGAPVRCAEAIGVELSRPFIEPDECWIDARINYYAIRNSRGERVKLPPAEPTLVVNRKVFDVELALKAARAEGHRSIGIDLEREHCDIAWGRLSQGALL